LTVGGGLSEKPATLSSMHNLPRLCRHLGPSFERASSPPCTSLSLAECYSNRQAKKVDSAGRKVKGRGAKDANAQVPLLPPSITDSLPATFHPLDPVPPAPNVPATSPAAHYDTLLPVYTVQLCIRSVVRADVKEAEGRRRVVEEKVKEREGSRMGRWIVNFLLSPSCWRPLRPACRRTREKGADAQMSERRWRLRSATAASRGSLSL